MTNRGGYRVPIEIWEKYETENTNELGEKEQSERLVKRFMAKVETRVGSLLSGNRPANTIVEKTTHKITYSFYNFKNLLPDRNFIKIFGRRFEIDYSLNDGFKNIEMQVFVHEEH